MFDLVLTGGLVVDGSGGRPYPADIGIVGDRIAAIGNLSSAAGRKVLALAPVVPEGRSEVAASTVLPLVCPGFIDAHTHSDTYLLVEPTAPSKLWQGVTTEIVGNCGASCAPLTGGYRLPSDWAAQTYPGVWRTVAEYRALLAQVRPTVNVRLLVGHNTLRGGVVGYADRPSTPTERQAMARLLEQAMDEGACGLSTGLAYAPGLFATPDEIHDLAAIVARRDGIYASHMRSESTELLEALDETLCVARTTGVRTQISHLKAAGRSNWAKLEPALRLLREARAAGLDVAADRYPYTSSCTDLDIVFPAWAAADGRDAVLARLRSGPLRRRLRDELLAVRVDTDWGTVTIASTAHPDNAAFSGQALTAVAAALGVAPVDAVLHLCETDELKTTAFFDSMNAENMGRVLAEPYVMLGSDASLRAPWGPLARDHPHPRAYGSFARALRMAIDGLTVAMPDAVRQMTSLPARQFGLCKRGELRIGYAADIVVIDPVMVRDTATYRNPHQLAVGIRHAIVNGAITLEGSALTGNRAGQFV